MPTVKFFTLGCKVNQYDTQAIREQFLSAGFSEADNGKKADIYLINTCTVTHRADSESLNRIRRSKRENPKAEIIVTGCLTELDQDKIKSACRSALIFKNQEKNHIVKTAFLDSSCLASPRNARQGRVLISDFNNHTRAFLKIQDGCDNFCSYCKVPLVRGRSRSRPLDEIAAEAQRLANSGFKEIVLCGICLGAYGRDLQKKEGKVTLVDVISVLEKIDGLLRIRLSSIEAGDVSGQLINKMSSSKKLCRHLHIPLQSGDDEILKKMNRAYCRADYLRLINKVKRKIPGIGLTTDVLVGFPGEGEGNFRNTLDLVKKSAPLRVHIFPYSRRPGTSATKDHLKNEVTAAIIKKRVLRLRHLAETCAKEYKKKFFGKSMEVLLEGRNRRDPGVWEGYTDNYIKVQVKSKKSLVNQLLSAQIK